MALLLAQRSRSVVVECGCWWTSTATSWPRRWPVRRSAPRRSPSARSGARRPPRPLSAATSAWRPWPPAGWTSGACSANDWADVIVFQGWIMAGRPRPRQQQGDRRRPLRPDVLEQLEHGREAEGERPGGGGPPRRRDPQRADAPCWTSPYAPAWSSATSGWASGDLGRANRRPTTTSRHGPADRPRAVRRPRRADRCARGRHQGGRALSASTIRSCSAVASRTGSIPRRWSAPLHRLRPRVPGLRLFLAWPTPTRRCPRCRWPPSGRRRTWASPASMSSYSRAGWTTTSAADTWWTPTSA